MAFYAFLEVYVFKTIKFEILKITLNLYQVIMRVIKMVIVLIKTAQQIVKRLNVKSATGKCLCYNILRHFREKVIL